MGPLFSIMPQFCGRKICLFVLCHDDAYTLHLALTLPPSFTPAALSSHLPFLTSCPENPNMQKEGKTKSVLHATHLPEFFIYFLFPLVHVHWWKSTRLTGCSKCSGSKKNTLLFLTDGCGIGSRGLARVRPNHSSLFLAISHCLSFSFLLFSLFLLSSPPCLLDLTVSLLYLLLCCVALLSLLFYITVLPVIFLLQACSTTILTTSSPSISSTPHYHHP